MGEALWEAKGMKKADREERLKNLRKMADVYLLPEMAHDREGDWMIGRYWKRVFEEHLQDWASDGGRPELNVERFKEWFEVELHANVVDLCRGPVLSERM